MAAPIGAHQAGGHHHPAAHQNQSNILKRITMLALSVFSFVAFPTGWNVGLGLTFLFLAALPSLRGRASQPNINFGNIFHIPTQGFRTPPIVTTPLTCPPAPRAPSTRFRVGHLAPRALNLGQSPITGPQGGPVLRHRAPMLGPRHPVGGSPLRAPRMQPGGTVITHRTPQGISGGTRHPVGSTLRVPQNPPQPQGGIQHGTRHDVGR
ncbi:MAG: hypothetical protein S4CHLAM37_07220 [Chlamydiia bacterium]|nr:hypothetical protein [Chlamydiia bacterium]